jgi:hypothetical protein
MAGRQWLAEFKNGTAATTANPLASAANCEQTASGTAIQTTAKPQANLRNRAREWVSDIEVPF